MAHYQEHSEQAPATSLPTVSDSALRFYRERLPTLDHLDREMRGADKALAGFVLARAGELVPGAENIAEKTIIARLALEVYGLLQYQAQVNNLENMFETIPDPEVTAATSGDDA